MPDKATHTNEEQADNRRNQGTKDGNDADMGDIHNKGTLRQTGMK